MSWTITLHGVPFRLVRVVGQDRWIVHYGPGPIGVLARVNGRYEASASAKAPVEVQAVLRQVLLRVRREGIPTPLETGGVGGDPRDGDG